MGDVINDRTDALSPLEALIIGSGKDSMYEVERRLRVAFPSVPALAWEADARTFQFTYVSPDASQLLGYPLRRWLSEPAFWVEQLVAAEDLQDAVAYCALAIAARRDHVFEYRAVTAGGQRRVMRDVVVVVLDERAAPTRLRGLMFDVTAKRSDSLSSQELKARQRPSRAELERVSQQA